MCFAQAVCKGTNLILCEYSGKHVYHQEFLQKQVNIFVDSTFWPCKHDLTYQEAGLESHSHPVREPKRYQIDGYVESKLTDAAQISDIEYT